ncbi:MAG TPA: dihydrodipicolinate synthase family protein [Chloroflexota bacterium]|nr:dihydrodipicolinate synthase family protein [Chloroflexota bacterium]
MQYRKAEAKQAAHAQFRGLWAAITTPFTPDGELDEAGLRRNMRHFTDVLHVDGVFCTGNMGEFWALTTDERRRSVEIVVEEARGKCLTIAQTAHHAAHETVALTRHAQEVGADYVALINPYYPAMDEAAIYDWFAFVAERVDIGIWMFDSEYSPFSMSPALIARVARLENVCGIKIGGSLDHYAAVERLCGDQIVLSHPSERAWLSLMRDHGQRAYMSSATPYLFQTATEHRLRDYTELGLAGRFEEAERIAAELEPYRQLQERWLARWWREERIIPIAYLKAWTELLGLAAGPVRLPLREIPAEERAAMQADLERVGLLRPAAARA